MSSSENLCLCIVSQKLTSALYRHERNKQFCLQQKFLTSPIKLTHSHQFPFFRNSFTLMYRYQPRQLLVEWILQSFSGLDARERYSVFWTSNIKFRLFVFFSILPHSYLVREKTLQNMLTHIKTVIQTGLFRRLTVCTKAKNKLRKNPMMFQE